MSGRRPLFATYVGIDYSGADRPDARIKGLAVAVAQQHKPFRLQCPPLPRHRSLQSVQLSKANLWSRRLVYEWLLHELHHSRERMIVGLDHGLSYPSDQLQRLGLSNWAEFLHWSSRTWKTTWLTMKQSKEQAAYVNSVAKRLVERDFIPSTKSVTDLDRISGMQGAVSYSTHTGLPWIYRLRQWQRRGLKVHFWPYDGLHVPDDCHLITEAYPALYRRRITATASFERLSEHERDAAYIAEWMQARDQSGTLAPYLELATLSQAEQQIALLEGWVLGCL
ncbi:hypothetical protein [Paenibacillus campi]|uniref:hypothetical protein n=1 Tax=Paenibacillus campi TaxID=3106031 RepID=UPI002AFF4285|nr:hypothetical protein [Paenibacillus sp. SGZ-1009]